jgi:hypothetical protein
MTGSLSDTIIGVQEIDTHFIMTSLFSFDEMKLGC